MCYTGLACLFVLQVGGFVTSVWFRLLVVFLLLVAGVWFDLVLDEGGLLRMIFVVGWLFVCLLVC